MPAMRPGMKSLDGMVVGKERLKRVDANLVAEKGGNRVQK
jgi:hypothetical protein